MLISFSTTKACTGAVPPNSTASIASKLGINPPAPIPVGIEASALTELPPPSAPGNLVATIFFTFAKPAATAPTAAIGPNIGPAPVGGGANAAAAAL